MLSGPTLNLQSYMGIIMAVGVSISNGVLLVTSAEQERRAGADAIRAALDGVSQRVRPILMTTLATVVDVYVVGIGRWPAACRLPLGCVRRFRLRARLGAVAKQLKLCPASSCSCLGSWRE
jgi:multidrug efflux pump subunit AcrB